MSSKIFYQGPSLLTGEPIVGVLSLHSQNRKTGDMAQTWILRGDQHPVEAVQIGADEAICGDCKLRGEFGKGRTCYVNLVMGGPGSIYKSLNRLEVVPSKVAGGLLKGRQVRLGAYGDPAAIPTQVWQDLLEHAEGWTAYTHQWRSCDPGLAQIAMASVDTPEEYSEAVAMGWRTFRCRTSSQPLDKDEVICPASEEGGHRVTCADCELCRGASLDAKSVAIIVHGSGAKWFSRKELGV